MTMSFKNMRFLKNSARSLRSVSPELLDNTYKTILSDMARYDHYVKPRNLGVTSTYINLRKHDMEAISKLIENNNITKHNGKNTYTPKLFKVVNIGDNIENQGYKKEQELKGAISLLTMKHDAFALFTNHNKCFLEDTKDIKSKNKGYLEELDHLVQTYRQFNNDTDPVILVGYSAYDKLTRLLDIRNPKNFKYRTALDLLKRHYPSSVANIKVVNQYVLDHVKEGANAIDGNIDKFGANDIVLINPNFATLYRGYSSDVVTNLIVSNKEKFNHHYFIPPSLQMISKNRAYRYTLY